MFTPWHVSGLGSRTTLTKLEPALFPFHTPAHSLLEPLLPHASFRALASSTPTYPRPQESVSGRPYERQDSTRLLSSPELFPNQRGNSEVVYYSLYPGSLFFFFFFNLSLLRSFSSHTLEERGSSLKIQSLYLQLPLSKLADSRYSEDGVFILTAIM